MKIQSRRDVAIYALLITAVAIVTTASFVHLATYRIPYPPAHRFAMLLATGLPLVIALPISIIALQIVRYVSNSVQKIEQFVKFDSLTGVLARSYYLESVRAQFGVGGALMLIDADHFKRVNDAFGHDVGDEALKVIGAALSAEAPPESLVGRIGGEEFSIFMPGANRDDAERLAHDICASIRASGSVIAEQMTSGSRRASGSR